MKFTTVALVITGTMLGSAYAAKPEPAVAAEAVPVSTGQSAQGAGSIPGIVGEGLSAYLKQGSKAAIDVWFKGSPLANDPSAAEQLTALLSRIETAYGKAVGYETIRAVTISNSFHRAYVLIKFEKGPLYAAFDCYKSQSGWTIPIIDLNPKASLILPPNILGGGR